MSASNTTSKRPTNQDLSGVCILVLDDDPNMRALIRGALVNSGCQNILMCRDARDALKLFSSHTIDLVISDLMMSPMSGFDFLRELRRPERGLNVPVIMLTASNESRDIVMAQKYKVSGWLTKPIALPLLIERVTAVLSLSTGSFASSKVLDDEVKHISERYRNKLSDDLGVLDTTLEGMQRKNDDDAHSWAVAAERGKSWSLIARVMHNIKGQAGSFNYELVTEIAALGQDLSQPLVRDTSLVYGHHDEAYRCAVALVQAMRLVVQNEIRGDGGPVGERLLTKLRGYLDPVRAALKAGADLH